MMWFTRLIIVGLSFVLLLHTTTPSASAQGHWSGSQGNETWRVFRVCPNGAEIDFVHFLSNIEPVPGETDTYTDYVENNAILVTRPVSLFTAYLYYDFYPSDPLETGVGNMVIEDGERLTATESLYYRMGPGKGFQLSLHATPTGQSYGTYEGNYLYTRDAVTWSQSLPIGTRLLFSASNFGDSFVMSVESCPDFDSDGTIKVDNETTAIGFDRMSVGYSHIPSEFLTYRIGELPSHGDLLLNDNRLLSGDSFTRAQLLSEELVYASNTITDTDAFTFTTNATYRVSVNGNDEQASMPTPTPTEPVIVAPGTSPTPTPTNTPGSLQPVVRNGSYEPSISADGSAVAFTSKAVNLHVKDGVVVPDDNDASDVFKRSFLSLTGIYTTELISIDSTNESVADGASLQPDIMANGSVVAYTSFADNLVAHGECIGIPDGQSNVYSRVGNQTYRRSFYTNFEGCPVGFGSSQRPSINDESSSYVSNIVAFHADGSVGQAGVLDTNGAADVLSHRHQLPTITTNPISVLLQFLGKSFQLVTGNGSSHAVDISDDGNYVVYATDASNLGNAIALPDTNGVTDIILRMTDSFTSSLRVSVTSNNVQAVGGGSYAPAISRFGDHIAFESDATNLMDEHNGVRQIYVYDRQVVREGHREFGCTIPISIRNQTTPGNRPSKHASISASGRYVAFESTATNLIRGDTNRVSDIYVVDRDADADYSFYTDPASCEPGPSRIFRVSIPSVISDGTEANGRSIEPDISGNGDFVAFTSAATNLVPDDTNGVDDVFVHYIGFTNVVRFKKVEGGNDPGGGNTDADVIYLPLIGN